MERTPSPGRQVNFSAGTASASLVNLCSKYFNWSIISARAPEGEADGAAAWEDAGAAAGGLPWARAEMADPRSNVKKTTDREKLFMFSPRKSRTIVSHIR